MQRVLIKAAILALVSMAISVAIVAAVMWPVPGDALMLSALCPLLIGFPASAFTFWQNEKLSRLNGELRATHAALEEAHSKLGERARRDAMTGFLNREAFFGALDGTRRRSDRGALLLVDADHFKRINDSYGHLVGDDALLEIADAIRRAVRERDVVGRIGGEEFGVYLLGANRAESLVIAERIRAEVEAIGFMPTQGRTMTLTVSVGGADCMSDAPVSEIMRTADRRLYEAKNAGRNRVVLEEQQRRAA